jgi:hypothetical protein
MGTAKDRGTTLTGIAVFLSLVTGGVALVAGLFCIILQLDFTGAGACFIAASLGFGLTANAMLRS